VKQLILGVILTCALLAPRSQAQRGVTGSAAGFNSRGFGGADASRGFVWGYSENEYDDGWPPDFSDGGTQAGTPPVILVMPRMTAPAAPPPPEPVRAVVREYVWPDSRGKAGSPFSIVSKDGTVRFAIAVWVQTGVVHFTAPDGRAGQLALNAVDRRATAQLNAEKRLRLTLP
jgi:hypothetical protein